MQTVDVIIVGQGIAGSMLAYKLWLEQKRFLVIDDNEAHSSRIASGIINPVTGRRFVKSWRIDALLAFADQVYPALEQLLAQKFYEEINILRRLPNHQEAESWLVRTLDPSYHYLHPDLQEVRTQDKSTTYGLIRGARLVHASTFLAAWRQWLIKQQFLLDEAVDYSALSFEDRVSYKRFRAQHLVYCDGWKIKTNPFFKHLPIIPTKGERLLVTADFRLPARVIKDDYYLLQLSNGVGWVGPTNAWDAPHADPTTEKLAELQSFLTAKDIPNFQLVEHGAAYRPAAHDRRPVLGTHPHFPQVHVINGLGTKGYSLAPYCAQKLYNYLFLQQALDPEMNWTRFQRKPGFITPPVNLA